MNLLINSKKCIIIKYLQHSDEKPNSNCYYIKMHLFYMKLFYIGMNVSIPHKF